MKRVSRPEEQMNCDHQLSAESVTLAYGDRTVVEALDLAVPTGRITAIVGANACGKSTLLRALVRLLEPSEGRVVLDGKDLRQRATKDVARTLGLLPQSPLAPEGIAVADLVARGRHPHQNWMGRWSTDDAEAVTEALAMTGTADLADRLVDELSGGQRQRVGSPWPWPNAPTSCCWTNPPPISTSAIRSRCWICSSISTGAEGRRW
ncbi:MAG: ABC transporter ATP-binding protein [Acidimicrobiales bacterium]